MNLDESESVADWWQHQELLEQHERETEENQDMTLPAIMVSDTGQGDFELIPAGNHVGICYLMCEIGTQSSAWGDKRQIIITWELPNEKMSDGRPFAISSFYTQSLSEKSNLTKDLIAWRGKQFTQKELDSFNLTTIIGKPCLIQVVHDTNEKGKVRAKIASVARLPKGMDVPEQTNQSVAYVLNPHNEEMYQMLPKWMQEKIAVSHEKTGKAAEPAQTKSQAGLAEDFDDDIPF